MFSSKSFLAKLCNSNFVREVNSTGNKVYIVFNSGFNLRAKGFKATYASYKRGKGEFENGTKVKTANHLNYNSAVCYPKACL